MLKHVVIAILATLTAIAILAFARRGERPIVYVGGSLPAGAHAATAPAWPPLAPRPSTAPSAGTFVRTYNVRDVIIDVLRFSRDVESPEAPMTPKRRRHWPAVLSLLLLAGVVTLWVRSKRWCDAAVLFLPGEGKAQVGASHAGRLHLVFTRVPCGPERAASVMTTTTPMNQLQSEIHGLADEPKIDQGRWGFRFARGEGVMSMPDAQGKYVLVSAPHWAFAALLAILPVTWIVDLLRHWRWKRTGRCLQCGYDLRGSHGACSECGAQSVVSGAPSRPASAPA